MTGVKILRAAIVLATVLLTVVLVCWADAESRQVGRPGRPGVMYIRLTHDADWAIVAVTFGVAALLATDRRTWRRPLSPGTIAVAVATLVTAAIIAFHFMTAPAARQSRDSLTILSQLDAQTPGAVIGAWTAIWIAPRRRRRDLMERTARLVGWLWVGYIALRVVHGFING